MGDLKTPWDKPIYGDTSDLSGQAASSRGSDPNADGDNGAGAGLTSFWGDDKRALPESSAPGDAESSNSVSGLPPLPNRYEPAETPPEPPDLTTRSPGTIDQQ